MTSNIVEYLQAKVKVTTVELLMGLNFNGWLLALLPCIRLGRQLVTLANTLAYYDAAKIPALNGSLVGPNKTFYNSHYCCIIISQRVCFH